MSALEELLKFTKVRKAKGEEEQAFLIRLVKKANTFSDDAWEASLSKPTQDWCNAANEASDAGKDLPSLPTGNGKDNDEPLQAKKSKRKAAPAPKAKAAKKAAPAKPAKAAVKAKTAKAAKAAKPAKAARKSADGPRAGTKLAKVAALLTRSKGCTRADILEATGWPSVSVQQQAEMAGLKLKLDKEGRIIRYRGF